MNLSCFCILLIVGDALDFRVIEDNTGLTPSMTVAKGTLDHKGDPIRSDSWVYEDDSTYTDPQQALENLVAVLRPSAKFIAKLSKCNTVSIRCSISSDLAQVGFDISSEILREISNYISCFEFSILSWGEVELDGGAKRPITDLLPDTTYGINGNRPYRD